MTARYTALETIFTVLDTGLSSLATAGTATSSAIDNDTATTQRWTNAMVEIVIAAQTTARDSGANVALYIVPTTDGTTYGDTASLANYFAGSFQLDATTTARTITGKVALPPTDYKVVFENNTGQTLNATGNSVKFREYGFEEV